MTCKPPHSYSMPLKKRDDVACTNGPRPLWPEAQSEDQEGRSVECRPLRCMSINAMAIKTQIVRAIPTARFHETNGSTLRASSKRCCTITKNPVFPIGANAAIQRPRYSGKYEPAESA